MNLDHSKVTHEQLLEQFKNRIISDPKFKDMSAAAIYQMYMEMMAGTFDMLHFYLGRTAEEMFLDSAKLDSSVIKLTKNLGYNPKRAIPATANIAIKLRGPLPRTAATGDVIWFNNEKLQLKFNNKPYRLDHCYSYTLNADDIANGVNNPNWSKTIQYSIPSDITDGWIPLTQRAEYLDKIKIVQCEIKTAEIYAIANAEHLTEAYQYYDIDDIKFSNYYGLRDPYTISNSEYIPANGWCKVGIGLNKTDAFSPEKLCDIEIENIYCNKRVKAANDELGQTKKLNVCRIESNQDKTVRITFGDGAIVNNGFNNEDEILYVQYVVTDGYAANTPDVVGSVLTNSSRIMAHSAGKLYDITDNISFVLTTNISNGDDFESAQRMKNSAAVYFASRGQLINKKDFNDYFGSMSRPIHAKNAIAWTATELKSKIRNIDEDYANALNKTKDAVFYTVIGDLYESLGNNKYTVKNVYTSNDSSIVGTTTLYNSTSDLLKHAADLAKCIAGQTQSIAYSQQVDKSDPFYLNTNAIYNDIEEKLQFGVVPISLPPIVQYFDLVGNVEIDRTTNVAQYQQDIESRIYKWLVDNQKFNNKIYKSDIIKMIYDNAATKSVNVDLTPSSLTKDTRDYYRFDRVEFNTTNSGNYVTSINGFKNNVIVIRKVSDGSVLHSSNNLTGNTKVAMSEAMLMSAMTVSIGFYDDDTTVPNMQDVTIKSITELSDDRLQIVLNDTNYNFTENFNKLWIGINTEEAQFYADHIASVGFATALKTLNSDVIYATSTNATPVPLPYHEDVIVDENANKVVERDLSYNRQNDRANKFVLNERSFNTYYMPSQSFYTDYEDSYKAVKHVIEDSILDDNNNIVRYSLPNEISVVRIKLRYTYGR
jgi:hypothetical protein